jgi:alkylation response protein AidB-like acyl-CoA dehydrogenase
MATKILRGFWRKLTSCQKITKVLLEKSEQISNFLEAIAPCLDAEETVNEFISLAAKIVTQKILRSSLAQCLQMLGARGYTENNLISRMLRDARVMRIFEEPTKSTRQSSWTVLSLKTRENI